MSEHSDATEDRPDEDLRLAREDREELGDREDEGDGPQPWAKLSSGDAE